MVASPRSSPALRVLAAALFLAACGERGEPEPPAAARGRGAAVYARYCSLCHGDSGEGYKADNAPALANQDFLRTASDDFIRVAIVQGRPGTPMSAWGQRHGGPLHDDDVDALVGFIRAWQREPSAELPLGPVIGQASRARQVYTERCASCHGAVGQGVNAVSLANPRLLASASDGFLRAAIAHGRRGTPMQAFERDLSPQTIDDLVALIRSWDRPVPSLAVHKPFGQAEGPAMPIEITTERAILNPDGAAPRFRLRDEMYVPADQVKAALDARQRLVILDARATSDWLAGHVRGAIPAPFYAIEDIAGAIPNDGTWIVAYCACPHAASGRVVAELRQRGYRNTAVMDEGIDYWREQGYPIEEGRVEVGAGGDAQGAH